MLKTPEKPAHSLAELNHENGKSKPPDLSIVLPIYNEAESLSSLFDQLLPVLDGMQCDYEIIAVNDGSRDNSLHVLQEIASRNTHIRIIDFRRNFGQTAALMAGFDHAEGDVIVTLDADLQNDPSDIPLLVSKINEGYDVVSGWRSDRKDARLTRNLPSRIANTLISRISGVKLNDYGCTLKAYRRDVMTGVRLYGEMHRFIPIYASWMGARVVEVPVKHHPRKFGYSKYGLNRIFKVVLDLIVVKFLQSYLVKPIYVFGGFGLSTIAAAFITLTLAIGLKFFAGTSLIQTPLPLLSAMLVLIGCISILMGLLAEMVMRTYFEAHGRHPYAVREHMSGPPSA
ncbi:glycosyltransferase family 2 protein [Hyphomonas sp.]|mgnify:FL=1|uniref:glycosyltransferase family 2 protein n=1 Tax=Hyphomonas sp. TaxID=87 RepID=UPI000C693068|nr:glycosyltransferase family 2 protein [Hyphomonas sp.]MAB09400.1 glycosyltransferase [Hyphomonas sp.]MAU68195.1 glycosyltransferase [Hyphomonas sp.]MBM57099.1 glycosyltransferase [Hyphomonas sp.]